ncbi:MAG: hypothetical protein AAF490_09235 [Chloroflexota bacterium]
MKDPYHTAFLPQLLAQFPDARFSMAKLFLCLAYIGIIPKSCDAISKTFGQHTLEKTTFLLNKGLEFSKTHQMPDENLIDLCFSEFAPNVTGGIE